MNRMKYALITSAPRGCIVIVSINLVAIGCDEEEQLNYIFA